MCFSAYKLWLLEHVRSASFVEFSISNCCCSSPKYETQYLTYNKEWHYALCVNCHAFCHFLPLQTALVTYDLGNAIICSELNCDSLKRICSV